MHSFLLMCPCLHAEKRAENNPAGEGALSAEGS